MTAGEGPILSKTSLTLSPTTLNLFRDCQRCFWLHINKGIQRPRGIFPSLPGGIDGRLKTYFNKYRGDGELPPLIRGKVPGKLSKEFPINLRYEDKELRVSFYGKLDDCLEVQVGIYAPLDHKTRGSKAKDVHPAYQVQMDAYTFLLEKNKRMVSKTAYLVYYVPGDGDLHLGFPFEVEAKELTTDPARTEALLRQAVKCVRGPLSEEGRDGCEYCAWISKLQKGKFLHP